MFSVVDPDDDGRESKMTGVGEEQRLAVISGHLGNNNNAGSVATFASVSSSGSLVQRGEKGGGGGGDGMEDGKEGEGEEGGCCCCGHGRGGGGGGGGFRYVILLLTVLLLTSICSNMIAFNFTLILMRRPNWENAAFLANSSTVLASQQGNDPNPKSAPIAVNATHVIPPTLPYTATEKARLLYAVGLASIASTFPFSALYTRFGARYVFLGAGLLSTLATAALPIAAVHGMAAFLAIRVLQGIAYGANFAAIGFVCHRWATLRQHGFFLACMTNFTSISVTLTNPVAAFISSSPALGWQWVYYVLALVSPLFLGLWLLLYTDHPNTHKCVNERERAQIHRGKSAAEIEIDGYMPYRAIMGNKVIWAVWLNAFADIVTAVFLITYLPTYVSKVLGYGVRETGIWSAIPALLHIPVKICAGWLADTMSCMSEVGRMRMFNSIALIGSAALFVLTGFVPKEWPFLAVLLMTANFAVVSANCGGFYKCATLISRQYSPFVIAGIQFEKSITLFVSPLLFLYFIRDESSHEQWRNVFLGMALVLAVANAFFWFFVTDQPAEFTKKTGKHKMKKEKLREMADMARIYPPAKTQRVGSI